ncbi:LacI family DNA-binding transcriptional regulator [Aerococcaceae bacterium zg-BR9]|uniref:LacI family DNA-binding transcriptional regulator n=1 Tax=Aerococcaceae bacterium zg-1292 TaxID=2774330 RepID=UPI004062ABF0|nr:LacI family DNA-binding transcriptional regulator [Aerococcaceae bacterium zg-BR9]
MPKKVSIKDVAKAAGVSISTVSNALNGVDVVTESTRQKVMEVAKELNYVPNFMGRQLKSGKTKMIGFYTKSIDPPYFSTVADTLARELAQHGYGLNIMMSNHKEDVIRQIIGGTVDGLIGFDEMLDRNDIARIEKSGLKTVLMDRQLSARNISSIIFDSITMGMEVTEYLIANGHTKIGFIKGFDGVYDSDCRVAGFMETMNAHNLPINREWIYEGGFMEELTYQETKKWVQNKKEFPTAIIAGNDSSAIGAIRAFKELKIKVPEDISLIGFDDIPLLKYIQPQLTTYHLPIAEQGKQAVKQLFKMLEQQETGKVIELEGNLVVRDSVKNLREGMK